MKVLIVNTSNRPLSIDGRMIAVGGQAVFDKQAVPADFHRYIDGVDSALAATEPEEVDSTNPLVTIQAQSIPAIKLKLPDLSIEDLQALKRLEESSPAPRAGVVDAVSAEILSRPV